QNGYTPAQNEYQVPAVRSTAPIQSNSQTTPDMFPMVPPATSGNTGQAPVFRPGSTGSVPAYAPVTGSVSPASPYSSSQSTLPLNTSASSSSVVPAGFNQTAPLRR
ncbi:MAG: hypothetical protein U9N87_02625, partial [Planctomycetota bacterium]|nr:hypothetical protein [Planctomycetota bacterium]